MPAYSLNERLAPDLDKIEAALQADLAALQTEIDPYLHEIITYGMSGGGKRIRPLLVALCGRLCGYDHDELYRLAIAFEYLHNATLFHDDVIDKAETRRGRPAIWRRFGMAAAILAGDFLHSHSMNLVGQLSGQEGMAIFSAASRQMSDGEFLQLRRVGQFRPGRDEYFFIIEGKTASLIAACCAVGALMAGAKTDEYQALQRYGLNLGLAFQIVDDILDYTGDSAVTGKKTGADLAEGKMTLPLIVLLEQAEHPEEILALLREPDEQRKLAAIATHMRRHDTLAACQEITKHTRDACLAALQPFAKADGPALEILRSLAFFVTDRQN
ncbi:MAG: polyprenyl synthetase family protein [Desulfobulbaceae bacterium]|jgi:octaprenyl-diphosphate synthase|nr:polyprenyl synthetase family protein [Desulfobulbaceae bacterium]